MKATFLAPPDWHDIHPAGGFVSVGLFLAEKPANSEAQHVGVSHSASYPSCCQHQASCSGACVKWDSSSGGWERHACITGTHTDNALSKTRYFFSICKTLKSLHHLSHWTFLRLICHSENTPIRHSIMATCLTVCCCQNSHEPFRNRLQHNIKGLLLCLSSFKSCKLQSRSCLDQTCLFTTVEFLNHTDRYIFTRLCLYQL